MRKVALVGFAESGHKYAANLPKDIELWTLNHAHKYGWRIDRMFEIHWRSQLEDPNASAPKIRQAHLDYLAAEHKHKIYMQEAHDDIPASVRYPIEDAIKLAGGKHFASSLAYMCAMAMLEEVDRVEIYGFNLGYDTEYKYQKPNALYWIGRMEGAGIDVDIQKESTLMPESMLYGYEASQMVTRHSIEAHMRVFKKQRETNLGQFNHWMGVFSEQKRSNKNTKNSFQAVETHRAQMDMAEGGIRALQHLLNECDLKETEL